MKPAGPIYLDYNASAPLAPAAADAMAEALRHGGNPSSVHGAGRAARGRVEAARRALARRLNVRADAITFTSGGTEANALAFRARGVAAWLVSAVEHDSVLSHGGGQVPADGQGRIDLAALEEALAKAPKPAGLSLMFANNETGVIQPVREAFALARGHGALIHCDAIQALGKAELDLSGLGADLVSLSAHKAGGPPGVGALVNVTGVELAPLLTGGGQEQGARAGTENVAGIAAFAAAVDALPDWTGLAQRLRDRLESALPGPVHGAGAPRLGNVSCIGMPGVAAETQVMALDLAGFHVSAGSACSSGKVKQSHVLRAMGVAAPGEAIRVSLGWNTTEQEIDQFIAAWLGLRQRLSRAA